MAELDTSGGGKKGEGKVRTKKKSTRVDLTAMVDLAFLLITFFIFSTTLQKPKAMDLVMPDKDDKVKQLEVAETRTLTLLLGSHDKLEWYVGQEGKSAPTIDNYGKNGLRKTLIDKEKEVEATHAAPNNFMIVIIKASDKATYKNVVSVMDELNIVGNKSRAIVNIMPSEVELLKRDGLY
jgi:biopolymer transport protein ExbD